MHTPNRDRRVLARRKASIDTQIALHKLFVLRHTQKQSAALAYNHTQFSLLSHETIFFTTIIFFINFYLKFVNFRRWNIAFGKSFYTILTLTHLNSLFFLFFFLINFFFSLFLVNLALKNCNFTCIRWQLLLARWQWWIFH